ncbi:ABC transporter ATP-binding protein [Helicobacter sp. 23-1044]
MGEVLLQAQNVGHSFESQLYDSVNLTMETAKTIAILGVSGSGKSTLINNLSSFLKPKNGSVFIGGSDIYALKDSEILRLRRNVIGIIFQFHYLFRGFSALENLQVASILANQAIDENLLESFGIAHILKQQIGELSGGQQQRLSIARVLTKKPRIIFADEPTGNLDAETTGKVMEVVFGYVKSQGATMIVATHNLELAKMCDKVFELKNCALVESAI